MKSILRRVISISWAALMFAAVSGCSSEVRRSRTRADSAIVGSRAAPRAPGDYVGLEYESAPRGSRVLGGALLPPGASGAGQLGFSYVQTPQGDMIWLDTIGATAPSGRPRRIVRAQLRIPSLARDERLFMASCDAGGVLDWRIVAIAVNSPNATRFTQIRQAWRADPISRRFDIVPIAGITCEEPGS